jgi:uncharacterized membrane protein
MEILSDFFAVFGRKAAILTAVYILVFMLILLDLWSGVRKAKRKGDYISSYGLRKTLNKIARYYNMLFAVSVIDILQMLAVFYAKYNGVVLFLPILPVFTFLAAIFIGIIEVKSIYEKSDKKDKARAADTFGLLRELFGDSEAGRIINNITDRMERGKEK